MERQEMIDELVAIHGISEKLLQGLSDKEIKDIYWERKSRRGMI